MSMIKTREIGLKSLDCIYFNNLVATWHYSFALCYHLRKRGKGYMGSLLFLTTACESPNKVF